MTRATWPLSRDAVEAAARALYESNSLKIESGIPWERQGEATRAHAMSVAEAAVRAALTAVLLAAVRTEAAE